MLPITEIAAKMGLDQDYVLPYGKYKAKIALDAIKADGPKGKMILVTAVTPTKHDGGPAVPGNEEGKVWRRWRVRANAETS